MSIHIYSPIIYIIFVKLLVLLPPCPESNIMKFIRIIHNVVLSLLSLLMLITMTIGTYQASKFTSLYNLLCLPFIDNELVKLSANLFLHSKYLEWGDTVFLHLSGKPISTLQYTHHMSTAFLMYVNMIDYISPSMYIFVTTNCFVHIWMYWYFAYPHGVLRPFRQLLTQSQIVQHIICISVLVFAKLTDGCEHNKYGNEIGLFCYGMYLFYFTVFYSNTYFKSKAN